VNLQLLTLTLQISQIINPATYTQQDENKLSRYHEDHKGTTTSLPQTPKINLMPTQTSIPEINEASNFR